MRQTSSSPWEFENLFIFLFVVIFFWMDGHSDASTAASHAAASRTILFDHRFHLSVANNKHLLLAAERDANHRHAVQLRWSDFFRLTEAAQVGDWGNESVPGGK